MNNSFLNIDWNVLDNNEDLVNNLSLKINLDKILITILVNRGFNTVEDINTFLNCKLKNTIPEPYLILDMEKAVVRISKAILNKEKVIVFGDYDVDGMTSTTLLIKALQFYNLKPDFFIPNRLKGSYGITKEFIDSAKSKNINLIIITDSGICSIDEVSYANTLGIDIVIFDHHPQLSNDLPKAIAVVDPNRLDQQEIDNAKIKYLCAAGVVFMFLIALNREMLKYNYNKINLLDLIQIAAIGTIGDLVPLIGINRTFIKYFLTQKQYLLGITALIDVLKIDTLYNSENIAFNICPVLNAAGRLGEQNHTVDLLMTNSYEKAVSISYELINLNERRKNIEKEIFEQANRIIYEEKLHENKAICVYNDMWHEGVIGIIAGKLKDKFNKPVFVISFDDKGFGKGSARSVQGLHIGEIINQAVQKNILATGGGHTKAGGLSIYKENINNLVNFLNEIIPNNIKSSSNIDYVLANNTDLFELFNKLKTLEPFGTEFELPVFCFIGIKLNNLTIVNNSYAKFNFSKYNVKCVIFNINLNQEFIENLVNNQTKLYDIIGQISYNTKFGLSFVIKDIRESKDRFCLK